MAKDLPILFRLRSQKNDMHSYSGCALKRPLESFIPHFVRCWCQEELCHWHLGWRCIGLLRPRGDGFGGKGVDHLEGATPCIMTQLSHSITKHHPDFLRHYQNNLCRAFIKRMPSV